MSNDLVKLAEGMHLTLEGKAKYEKRLEELRTVKRPQISERIRTAREFGDISENAEYESAKAEQALLEGEILELEKLLRNAIIITDVNTDAVNLGHFVTVRDLSCDEIFKFSIVGTREADPRHGKLSNESPLGKAIMGKGVGAEVSVRSADGSITWRIEAIESKDVSDAE